MKKGKLQGYQYISTNPQYNYKILFYNDNKIREKFISIHE